MRESLDRRRCCEEDDDEHDEHGVDARGDELPDWVANKRKRLEKIRDAKAALEAEAAAEAAATSAESIASGQSLGEGEVEAGSQTETS
ncbi:MAG TPA: hypothetical protein VG755_45030 [Nannocystaceae bacterium]|nr:hypothetical protein [Nannocystaceae bacterium]